MTSFIMRTFFLLFVGFIIVIRSSLVEIHTYSRIASMDNKMIADQQSALFTGKITIVDCVIRCALTQHCVSVFYLPSSCKGYPNVFSSTSPGLTTLTGAQYFVCETANLTSEVVYEATTFTPVSTNTESTQVILTSPVSTGIASTQASVSTGIASTQASVSTGIASTQATTSTGIANTQASVSTGIASTRASVSSDIISTQATTTTGIASTQASVSTVITSTQASVITGVISTQATTTTGIASTQASVSTGITSTQASVSTGIASIQATISTGITSTQVILTSPVSAYIASTQASVSTDITNTQASVSTGIISTQTTTSNGNVDTCLSLGYLWNAMYNICYKLHTNELDAVEAKAKCQSEDASSRLLLVDSDDTYSFAANIVGAHDTGGIYLQGILSGSDFVDDDGHIMNYFKWMDGEPGSGEHICFDDVTLKQETCSGGSPNQFICRFYF